MTSYVDSFKSLLNNTGIHQNNNFDVEISFDGSSKLVSNLQKFGYNPIKASELLRNCCYQINPGVGTIQTSMVRTYGEPFEMPYGKTYEPLNMAFYMDNNGDVYKILYLWMESVWNSEKRYLNFLNDYCATIDVIFNKRDENKRMMKIRYEKAYIKTISPVPLSGLSGNTATQFDVTFAYRKAQLIKLSNSSFGGIKQESKIPESSSQNKTYPGGRTAEQWKNLPPWERLGLAHKDAMNSLRANGATEEDIKASTDASRKQLLGNRIGGIWI